MSILMSFKQLNALQIYWKESCDKRTSHLPGIGEGPWSMVIFLILYVLFVTWIGPKWMANRKPFVLRGPMLVYNTTMVILNSYFFIESVKWLDGGRQLFNFKWPNQDDRSAETLSHIWSFYLYWLTKFIDLLDTVFFVLRKKYSQITPLHIYHHISVPIIGWTSIWLNPVLPVLGLFSIMNCLIHVIMYSYYALASFGPSIQKYLWWKKYITMIQLGQFVILFIYALMMLKLQQNYPFNYAILPFINSPLFFIMFFNFYQKSYHRKHSDIINNNSINSKMDKNLANGNVNGKLNGKIN